MRKEVYDKVYNFPTKHKEGFIQSEIDQLLENYPNINKDNFDNALCGITCMMKDEQIVIYHCDIEKAILCGIENRNLSHAEWD